MPRQKIVDNPRMLCSTDWQPVLASHALRASDNIVGARVAGQDLAVWRSATGLVQIWRDRCPHRGVQLSLGRIVDGRLACAYHGWEFAADTGRCMAVPALADLAAVPGQVCATVFAATEALGMVWVQLQSPAAGVAAGRAALPAGAPAGLFLRSLCAAATMPTIESALRQRGLAPVRTGVWVGLLDDQPLRLFVTCVQDRLTLVHAWLDAVAEQAHPEKAFAALRRLRSDTEAVAA